MTLNFKKTLLIDVSLTNFNSKYNQVIIKRLKSMSDRSKASTIILIVIGATIIGFGAFYIINLQIQINNLSGDSGIVNT